jgi:hypothetical protein
LFAPQLETEKRKIKMKKHLALLAIGAAMISAPALANTGDMEAKAQDYLEKADTDKNGQVSKAEHDAFAAQDPSATKVFSAADTNGDGELTLAELTIAKQNKESAEDANDTTNQ